MTKKILHILKTAWGVFPLSFLGLFLLGTSYLFWRFYISGKQDFLILVITLGILIVLALSCLQLVLAIILFFTTYKKQTLNEILGQTESSFWTGFKLGRSILTPSIEYTIEWKFPLQVNASLINRYGVLREFARSLRRIEADHVTRVLRLTDLLGIVKFNFQFTLAQKVLIKPNVHRIPPHEALRLFSVGDEISHPEGQPVGDLIEMRQYAPGDPLNRILWRVYGRNRKLMTRLPEKSIAQKKKTLAYLLTGKYDEPAASSVWLAVQKGFLGEEFEFSTDGDPKIVSTKGEACKAIISSCNAPEPANNLESFFSKNPDANKTNCILFATPEEGQWIDIVSRLSKKSVKNLTVLLSLEGFLDKRISGKWKSWFLELDENFQHQTKRVKSICQKLKSSGVEVNVLDFHRGRFVPPLQLEL